MVDFTDFLPTFAELAGGQPLVNARIDGTSFWPRLTGEGRSLRQWVFSQFRNDYFIRSREWKLMRDGRIFHSSADPLEAAPYFPDLDSSESAEQRHMLSRRLDLLLRGQQRATL